MTHDAPLLIVQGSVAPGFEAVRQEFARNLDERGEVGAAFAAFHNGQPIVDLWGGTADPETRRPWQEDTIQVIFSGTKGLVAVCLLLLIDRGLVHPDAPVADYWPEFASAGKHKVRISDVASHQSRLPGIRTPLTEADVADDRRMAELLATQPQEVDLRARDAYHPLTYGWLCGEVVRRVAGRSVGKFFAEEVAVPLGLDLWIGLPERFEERVATLVYAPDWGAIVPSDTDLAADDLASCVWNNPPLFPADRIPWNTRAFHAAEIPGAGGIGSARSIARLYASLARGGELDDVRILSTATIDRARTCLTRRRDPLLDEEMAYGLGFELQTGLAPLGPAPEAFGHTGAGGSVHGAWPLERVGFSYCMNQMRDSEPVDSRARALLDALHSAVR